MLIKPFQDIGSPSDSRVKNNVCWRRQLILYLPTLGFLLFAVKHLLLTVARNRVRYIDFKIQDVSFISLPSSSGPIQPLCWGECCATSSGFLKWEMVLCVGKLNDSVISSLEYFSMETFYNFTEQCFTGEDEGSPTSESGTVRTPVTNQWKYKTITQRKDRIACKDFRQFLYQ